MENEESQNENRNNENQSKGISAENSKWAWFILVIIILLVVLGAGWFIIKQNEMLTSEIEGGLLNDNGRATSKVLKEMSDAMKEMKKEIEENGAMEGGNGKLVAPALAFTLDYPIGWHVTVNDDVDAVYTSISEQPFFLYNDGRSPVAAISVTDIEEKNLGYIEELMEANETLLTNAKTTEVTNSSGILFYLLQGDLEGDALDGPPPYPNVYTYYGLYFPADDSQQGRIIIATAPIQSNVDGVVTEQHKSALDAIVDSIAVK